MKINRINLFIDPKRNTHKKFLYNEVLDFTNKVKVGGEFATNHIKLSGVPENFLKYLEELKINFERR